MSFKVNVTDLNACDVNTFEKLWRRFFPIPSARVKNGLANSNMKKIEGFPEL